VPAGRHVEAEPARLTHARVVVPEIQEHGLDVVADAAIVRT
jgi:hypothetical protein